MPTDKRVDAYIARSADFAKPILLHIRKLVHQACPEVVETMKWSFPHFDYKGMMCSMASFKQHCAFGFWKASLMQDYARVLNPAGETAMGHFGQLKSLKDLPADKVLLQYLKEAVRLNDTGAKVVRKQVSKSNKILKVPADFKKALERQKKALGNFEDFSYSQRKEYIDWIIEAKTDATRAKRIATAVEWLGEGKVRNWKYMR